MNQYQKVAFYTLGCKLNFSETSTIARQFTDAGYAKVDFEDMPDIVLINTCSVTDNADKKCREIIRKAKRINPNNYIIVVGCYAQLKPEQISSIEGVNLVLGANEKFNVVELYEKRHLHTQAVFNDHIKTTKEFVSAYSIGDRTRSFLKIQDGCDYFCSFCTIPLARGRSRSALVSKVVKQAKELADKGVNEIVLTGVNIGDFGSGTDENFLSLIKELDKVEGIEQYRISSIEPNLLSNDIIEFVANSRRFAHHFHIPLQSGSDKVLKLMRRRYDTKLYRQRIEYIKRIMPNACIGVDVIVGFPNESEKDFKDTYQFLTDLDISYLHVFTYSERANTTALRIENKVPVQERKERSKMLRILSEKKKRYFYQSQIGKTEKVLFEKQQNDDFMYGYTKNYLRVKAPYNPFITNSMQTMNLFDIDREGNMQGEFVQTMQNTQIQILQ